MERPKLSDHTTSGSMIAPYGGADYDRYIKALNDYIDFLLSEDSLILGDSSNYDIPETVKRTYKEFRESTNCE